MPRNIYQIASEIAEKWKPVNYAAKPYLEAMFELKEITDNYYQESARGIVTRFLGNATTWRGEDARRIKAELKALK